jgi:integrase
LAKIDSVDSRTKLKPQHEPYWVKLLTGCYLGFRKMTPTSKGTWIARFRNAETGQREKRSLGEFEEMAASLRYDAAKTAAEEWFSHLGKGGASEVVTVKVACERYVEQVRAHRGDGPADDIKGRFTRWVYTAKVADIELAKLRKEHIDAWRKSLVKSPVKVTRSPDKDMVTRERSASAVNRDMTPLRAALNHAHDAGHVTSDMAWRVALRPVKNADGRRDVYLDRDQRRALIDNVSHDVGLFLRGMCLVPLRPGALAAFSTSSFDARLGVLTIGKDKAGRDRKIKLPTETAAFFLEQAKGKLPAAPLFSRVDGKPWDKDAWKKPVKAGALAAELPPAVTAYALRHSVITDLVTGGLDLLTVAQLSGTSVAMIEKHYGHLRADHAAAALANLAL